MDALGALKRERATYLAKVAEKANQLMDLKMTHTPQSHQSGVQNSNDHAFGKGDSETVHWGKSFVSAARRKVPAWVDNSHSNTEGRANAETPPLFTVPAPQPKTSEREPETIEVDKMPFIIRESSIPAIQVSSPKKTEKIIYPGGTGLKETSVYSPSNRACTSALRTVMDEMTNLDITLAKRMSTTLPSRSNSGDGGNVTSERTSSPRQTSAAAMQYRESAQEEPRHQSPPPPPSSRLTGSLVALVTEMLPSKYTSEDPPPVSTVSAMTGMRSASPPATHCPSTGAPSHATTNTTEPQLPAEGGYWRTFGNIVVLPRKRISMQQHSAAPATATTRSIAHTMETTKFANELMKVSGAMDSYMNDVERTTNHMPRHRDPVARQSELPGNEDAAKHTAAAVVFDSPEGHDELEDGHPNDAGLSDPKPRVVFNAAYKRTKEGGNGGTGTEGAADGSSPQQRKQTGRPGIPLSPASSDRRNGSTLEDSVRRSNDIADDDHGDDGLIDSAGDQEDGSDSNASQTKKDSSAQGISPSRRVVVTTPPEHRRSPKQKVSSSSLSKSSDDRPLPRYATQTSVWRNHERAKGQPVHNRKAREEEDGRLTLRQQEAYRKSCMRPLTSAVEAFGRHAQEMLRRQNMAAKK